VRACVRILQNMRGVRSALRCDIYQCSREDAQRHMLDFMRVKRRDAPNGGAPRRQMIYAMMPDFQPRRAMREAPFAMAVHAAAQQKRLSVAAQMRAWRHQ